jgi:hypothetical protein
LSNQAGGRGRQREGKAKGGAREIAFAQDAKKVSPQYFKLLRYTFTFFHREDGSNQLA